VRKDLVLALRKNIFSHTKETKLTWRSDENADTRF
jgi:hypothetical protein